jgi:hypothetical protein
MRQGGFPEIRRQIKLSQCDTVHADERVDLVEGWPRPARNRQESDKIRKIAKYLAKN